MEYLNGLKTYAGFGAAGMLQVFGQSFMESGDVEKATAAAISFGLIGLGHKVQKLIEAQSAA